MSLDFIKTIPQYLLPQKALTGFAGCLANVKNTQIKNYLINSFIKKFHVNMNEAIGESAHNYSCFNEFFIRHLKPDCRPLAQADIISPVDGGVSEIGLINQGQIIQAKGHMYTVAELLVGTEELAQQFYEGQFATLYLSPKDYHRVHMPMDAKLVSMRYVPGALFSVQPRTTRVVPKLFARNERLVLLFDTAVGPMALVMVGAVIVGAIGTTWHGELKRSNEGQIFSYSNHVMNKGDEVGYFKLGSTVIVLFADGKRVTWNPNLQAGSVIRFGEAFGTIS